ncbi:hypothetical protein MMC18_005795 [Xylographa bjoerkii]|nr:hypothetical protein [Xylographa bjoerkii]
MTANIPPQPDFAAVSQAFHTAGAELAKCPDIVSFHQSTEVIQLLRNLTASVNRIERSLAEVKTEIAVMKTDIAVMKTDIAEMKTDIAGLKMDKKASRHNEFAREQNRMLHNLDDQLAVFHTSHDIPVPHFPETPRAMQGLRARALGELLQALGLESNGSLEEKLKRFRLVIGLRTDTP